MASSHSGLIPLKTVYKKRVELLWAIASKKNFSNLHSTAFVTVLHVIWSVPTNFTFFNIFTHADVVNAQTWEVTPLKNPDEPP